ncbi:MAG: trypsin-like peptidase domain-containing protein [Chlamydiales bacterium]|nr:trypsin-like peptidase domain-containing protein [Chlamydiales bacterium]
MNINAHFTPTVRIWDNRYQSQFAYTSDGVAQRVNNLYTSTNLNNSSGLDAYGNYYMPSDLYNAGPARRQYINLSPWSTFPTANYYEVYSDDKRAFYGVVPHNTQPSTHYQPLCGQFDETRLPQKDVFSVIQSHTSTPSFYGSVSLSNTIAPLINQMGSMHDSTTGRSLGTCTLIAYNLVLTTRHAVEGIDVRNIKVTFGYSTLKGKYYSADNSFCKYVIENNTIYDYAIIKLAKPLGSSLGFVSLTNENNVNSELALLHYPLGKPLKVSVHTSVYAQYERTYLLTYHDSDYVSSGGAYFDTCGRMVAMHLGAQIEENCMNLLRYALPFSTIVKYRRQLMLSKFVTGALSQACSYELASSCPVYTLLPCRHSYLIDEEGAESEKELRKHLAQYFKTDKNIILTAKGTIAFTSGNLQYIENQYPNIFKQVVNQCLGKSGLHCATRQYSIKKVIESDHTIPHDVWKSTTFKPMLEVTGGSGNRAGENDMPAITIPYAIHRKLLTTGSSTESKEFRKKLTKLCDKGRADQATYLCVQEYKKHGLNLKDYEQQIKDYAVRIKDLGIITNGQKDNLLQKLFP